MSIVDGPSSVQEFRFRGLQPSAQASHAGSVLKGRNMLSGGFGETGTQKGPFKRPVGLLKVVRFDFRFDCFSNCPSGPWGKSSAQHVHEMQRQP